VIPGLEREITENSQSKNQLLRQEVTENDIAEVVAKWTGIPVTRMLESEQTKLLEMETRLGARVIGQKPALDAVSRAVRRSRAGLSSRSRPMGSFLFMGPTGVGKTETAKALAEFLFDDEKALIRIDMSEYMEKHSVSRLLGAPPGYIGFEEGGTLTEAVRRRPYSVVLLDEVEKAHPDVFNIFLQVLDDGRITDSQGRTIDFTNTLIIMTSNLDPSKAGEYFRPEFLNRIDEMVIFSHLQKSDLGQIVAQLTSHLNATLLERGIHVELDPSAQDWMIEHGYDSAWGARPLTRLFQREIQDRLANELISGKLMPGSQVKATIVGNEMTLNH
jgi:ATP-dependent Clp protease ATP-binding subunit ClpB